jgi:hypothetical protein
MSGGAFDYNQRAIHEIAESIQELIDVNGIERLNEYNEDQDFNFSDETINEFKWAVGALNRAYVYAQRIDWLVSGDDGEDSFLRRLDEDLENLEQTR